MLKPQWLWKGKRMVSSAKQLVISSALKSDYAKRTYDFAPTWVVSYILRTLVEFTLYYRLYSTNYIFNLFMAVCVSVTTTICSPFFYDLVWQYKGHIKKFTDHVANHMSWDYFYIWQQRIVLGIAVIAIVVLTQVKITSWWLIECIIHTIVCGFIMGKFEELREYIHKPHIIFVEAPWYEPDVWKKDTRYVVPLQKQLCARTCHFDPDRPILDDYRAPTRAKRVHISDGCVYNINNFTNNGVVVSGHNVNVSINNVYISGEWPASKKTQYNRSNNQSKEIILQRPGKHHRVKKRSAVDVVKHRLKYWWSDLVN